MTFRDAVQKKDFVISAELPLTPESTQESIMADAHHLHDWVDGYVLTDNHFGRPHIAPSAAAHILLRNGLSPILQLGCRTRNRVALLGELLGARAVGIDSLMLVRGSAVPVEFRPRPVAVMDVGCRELIAIAKRINDDEKLGSSRTFLIGTSATVHDPNPQWRADELSAKADAGATLVVTQLCLDPEILRRYMGFLVEQQLVRRLSVIVSIAVIESVQVIEWLRQNRQDSIVPAEIGERLANADDVRQEAISICAETLRQLAHIPGISGVNFAAAGSIDSIAEVIERSGIPQ